MKPFDAISANIPRNAAVGLQMYTPARICTYLITIIQTNLTCVIVRIVLCCHKTILHFKTFFSFLIFFLFFSFSFFSFFSFFLLFYVRFFFPFFMLCFLFNSTGYRIRIRITLGPKNFVFENNFTENFRQKAKIFVDEPFL